MTEFFDGVTQTPRKLSKGSCDLPIFYRDGACFGVFYRVELALARALLEPYSVEPWPIFGAAVAAIYAWEYRDSSVGSYGEVGIGIQARRRGSSPSIVRYLLDMSAQDDQGIWVNNLPVTTEEAHRAGVEIWGYPKYVTPIETDFGPARARARLGDELELSIGRMRGPRIKLPVVTYTALAGRLQRTHISVDHRVRLGGGRSVSLRLLGGDGPCVETVRALALDRRRAIAAFRTDRFVAQLPAGVDLGPSAAAT